MPPGRQLIRSRRPPRQVPGYLYLLRGSLQLSPGRYKLKARRSGTLPYFFPGCERARTLATCQILRVDARHREFALHRCGVGALPVAGGSESWLQRFLSSSMMRRLSPAEWQRVLAAFTPIRFSAGAPILKRGQYGEACFVLERTHCYWTAAAPPMCPRFLMSGCAVSVAKCSCRCWPLR